MIFDLKTGKRRRVVQVVFGFLAFIFFISFVGFGVGSDVTGGIFDALGIGGGSSSSDPQYEQQIEDAQSAVDQNPKDGSAYGDLIAAYYGSAQQGISRDSQTGQLSISADAQTDLEHAAQAWDDYYKTKPDKLSTTAAASAVQVFVLLSDATGAAQAQEVVAGDQNTFSAYATLALYLYADNKIKEGDAAGDKAVSLADPSNRKQVQKTIDGYREQAIKFQQQLEQPAAAGRLRPGPVAAREPVRRPRNRRPGAHRSGRHHPLIVRRDGPNPLATMPAGR